MSNKPTVSVHEIEDLPLRSLFAREDREFTPWLAETDNLARLSRTLGFEMDLTATEASTGSFRTDILATRSQDGVAVVIENQFGRSDHDHFGKSLTLPCRASGICRGVDCREVRRRTPRITDVVERTYGGRV